MTLRGSPVNAHGGVLPSSAAVLYGSGSRVLLFLRRLLTCLPSAGSSPTFPPRYACRVAAAQARAGVPTTGGWFS